MAGKKGDRSFEEYFDLLEESVKALKDDNLTLEQSFENYQKGMEYYERCKSMLDELKQKIQVYDRRLDAAEKIEVE